ncbi:hypothetical protein MS5N3_26000 [Marinobacter salsuginis]|uniref:Uncharacterized protein n=1 Tax=Marinobacter salsuginis TaxID=418719 RepID=A0A5M3PQX5_9GAMM|nr:hypothetical protein MS5N3_26000 [Marinobacter salsuginis]
MPIAGMLSFAPGIRRVIGDEVGIPDAFANNIGDLRAIPARPEVIRNFLRVIQFAISALPLT